MRETSLELAWEKRKRRYLTKELSAKEAALLNESGGSRSLTDDDLDELKGSIELGFGFEEENGGHNLRGTLPALDLYFHVNRQLQISSPSSASTPSDSRSCSFGSPSPRSPHHFSDSNWKICTPGDNPEDVKTRLRHWAQAVACSLKQQSR
ncbi:hypothetical protein QJS04_geneDACA013619 [Acorus gramineus]|uniref:Uncharacterized protein n=1 Tax=Acorus gramineus TaxID=55184 RepID=A0AAV9AFY4_ACOGR|nr:hypothetical protein QJS04_geneDACA013619 [Acorus gramineus]